MTLAIFYISLFGLIAVIYMKALEIFKNRKMFLGKLGSATDHIVLDLWHLIKNTISHINIKNFIKFFVIIWKYLVKMSVKVKRRLDGRQPKFLIKQDRGVFKNNGSVSFFLKNVSEYKDSLKNK